MSIRKILITGASGYIGSNVIRYLQEYNELHNISSACAQKAESSQRQTETVQAGTPQSLTTLYQIDTLSLRETDWEEYDFSGYTCVLHLAGKAHADIDKLSEAEKQEYYKVNCDLAVRVAGMAKAAGVPQFIYMSSVIVYGDSAGVGYTKHITAATEPTPANFYGDSKWQAEQELVKLADWKAWDGTVGRAVAGEKVHCDRNVQDGGFQVAIVRSPMVYGQGSKGNFPMLVKIAERTPIFPKIQNERSMIYIENLTEFLRLLIDSGQGGIYLPQNAEYTTTAEMVHRIGACKGKHIHLMGVMNPFVRLAGACPGKVGKLANKAFGSLTIEQGLTGDITGYQRYSVEESIERSVLHIA